MAKRWKRHELETARLIDPESGERNPSNGRRQNDIDALGVFAIEHKSTRGRMMFVRNAMFQAVEGARKKGDNQTPVVAICSGVGKGNLERWIVMRLADWAPMARAWSQATPRARSRHYSITPAPPPPRRRKATSRAAGSSSTTNNQ